MCRLNFFLLQILILHCGQLYLENKRLCLEKSTVFRLLLQCSHWNCLSKKIKIKITNNLFVKHMPNSRQENLKTIPFKIQDKDTIKTRQHSPRSKITDQLSDWISIHVAIFSYNTLLHLQTGLETISA